MPILTCLAYPCLDLVSPAATIPADQDARSGPPYLLGLRVRQRGRPPVWRSAYQKIRYNTAVAATTTTPKIFAPRDDVRSILDWVGNWTGSFSGTISVARASSTATAPTVMAIRFRNAKSLQNQCSAQRFICHQFCYFKNILIR